MVSALDFDKMRHEHSILEPLERERKALEETP